MSKKWTLVKIKDICTDVNVGFVGPSTSHRDDEGIPFLMGKNVGPGFLKLTSLDRVTRAFHEGNKKSQLRAGDVVVVRIGNSGQAAVVPEDFGEANCSGLVIIKHPMDILADYLVYYLNSPTGRAYSMSQAIGSTRSTLNTKTVAETLIPLPPMEEQKRIVAKLDQALGHVDELEQNAKLNLRDIDQLWLSALGSLMAPPPKSSENDHVRLGDIATLVNGRAYKKEELLDEGKYRVLRVGNFFSSEHWYWSDLELDEHKYCDSGDLLYAWSASFGPRIWTGERTIFHYHIWKVLFDESLIVRDWLKYWFEWDVDRVKAAAGVGTTMLHVTKGAMEDRKLIIPPLPEQKEIVRQLDRLASELGVLKSNVENSSLQRQSLRSSILSAAFAGDL